MMLGMMVHLIVTTKHHLDQPSKSFIHYIYIQKLTLVNHSLTKLSKIITNSKLLKIFRNPHLINYGIFVSSSTSCPLKIINVNKQFLSTNPLSELMYSTVCELHWSCPRPKPLAISYLWTINSPNIVQMTSNLAKGCTITCQMMFTWCLANLV